jgi:hypothetical protein
VHNEQELSCDADESSGVLKSLAIIGLLLFPFNLTPLLLCWFYV